MSMSFCRKCGIELSTDNWAKSSRKYGHRICKACNLKETQSYRKTHPNRVKEIAKVYMREYMRDYRKKYPERIRKTLRLEQHRRNRELPTDIILNEHFEGAHLHHMTPSVAVYIPQTLHRSVYHNLKTGQGMDEINAKVMAWDRTLNYPAN